MSLPLNIDWQQILLHLFNFVVLFGILYYFLYSPVKSFMDKRTEYYKKLDDDAKSNLEMSEKTKAEYLNKLAAADNEILAKNEKARKEMEAASEKRIKGAEEDAAKIIAQARQSLEIEHAKMLKEAQNEISDMVVTATEKVILQSGTSESYEQFLAAVERGGEDE